MAPDETAGKGPGIPHRALLGEALRSSRPHCKAADTSSRTALVHEVFIRLVDMDVQRHDRALVRLAENHAESAKIVELQYFGGLSAREIGEVVGLSRATVERRVRFAKAWLHRFLTAPG